MTHEYSVKEDPIGYRCEDPRDAHVVTPEQRLEAVAEILARGVRRLFERQQMPAGGSQVRVAGALSLVRAHSPASRPV